MARQGIYDRDRSVVAYALTFRNGESEGMGKGTSKLIAATFGAFDILSVCSGRPVFITFTRAFLTGVMPIPLDPDDVVIGADASLVPDHELVVGIRTLADRGYRIAVTGCTGDVGEATLLELADFVSIDADTDPAPMRALPPVLERAVTRGATLMATGITEAGTLEQCQELGCELFLGPFLQRPVVMEGRALSPIQLACARLLNLLSDVDVSMAELARMVGTDPGLSMRLLRTANSASNSLSKEVTSLQQAIVLLGPQRLRTWVVLTLLEGSASRDSDDGLSAVLARAIACQRLAPAERDVAYTIGLLSGCADLLGTELDSVAEASGLGGRALEALVDRVGPAGAALGAVIAHENDDLRGVIDCGLVPFEVSRVYLESLSEALTVVHGLTAG